MAVDYGYFHDNRLHLEHTKLRNFYFHNKRTKRDFSDVIDELELPALETFVLTHNPSWLFHDIVFEDETPWASKHVDQVVIGFIISDNPPPRCHVVVE